MNYICVNGELRIREEPVIRVDDRGWRYGDGVFETIRVKERKVPLGELHFERLFESLEVLGLKTQPGFSRINLEKYILNLCHETKCADSARVRLTVSAGSGNLGDKVKELNYIIEAWPIDDIQFNEKGLRIDVFPGGRKTCDKFSAIKSTSFQLYSLAARYAREQGLDDCLIMNSSNRLSDSTIANLFLVRNGVITTPALTEGCVGGVMRKYLIEKLQAAGYKLQEDAVDIEKLLNADEIFLTNAVRGIRWVKQFREKAYSSIITGKIYDRYVKTIFG